MDANEQRAVALLKKAAGGHVVIHPDTGYVNIEWAIRAIMAALAQQVPADGEWERFGNLLALEGSPRLIDAWNKLHSQSATPQASQPELPKSVAIGSKSVDGDVALALEWVLVPREATDRMIAAGCDAVNGYRVDCMRIWDAMLAATPQAPQPVVDDNGLIVHGDWYTVEHTGTHIFDLDDDRERLLSILLYSNGDVGFAARVEGVGSWQGKATDPVFREALAALGDPRRHDLALGTNPPASQPQQGAVAWEVSDGIAKSFAWKESDTAPWRNEPGYTIRPLIYGDTIGQQAVDAFDAGWRTAAAWAYRDDLLADMDSSAYKTERGAALAAHGKGG